jgi:muramoyltetrapeptide carboxypeptidase
MRNGISNPEKPIMYKKYSHVIKPPRLKKGDHIGVVSPAGPVQESDLKQGLDILEQAGFRVRLGPHIYDRIGYLAGTDKDRLSDLNAMLENDEIKAVFCGRGGYGSMRILDRIRYDLIVKNPKILVGYSDITALLMAVYVKTGMVAFHGPMVRTLALADQGNWQSLIRLLTSDGPVSMDLSGCSILAPGRATGPLIGGNLSLLCHLLGTRFMPSLDGCILFIEDTEEPLYRLDRMLTHLSLSRVLDGISGIIAGGFEGCSDVSQINTLLSDIASALDIPLVADFPLGHGEKNIALPIGMTACLDTGLLTLTTKDACVI